MSTEDLSNEAGEPRHFRNVSDVLPDFDPVRGSITIERWIDKIEEYGELYNWDDVAIKHYGLSKLAGVAKTWRDSLTRTERSWNDWCVLLRESFPEEESLMSIRLEAQNYKRKSNQDIIEYFYEKLARCNKAEMSDKEAIEWIVHGLNNMRFRDHLGPLSRYSKSSQLLPDLRNACKYINETEKKEFKPFNNKGNNGKVVKCYNCKDSGHLSKNCNKAKTVVCFKCNKTGHYARECGKDSSRNVVSSNTGNSRNAVMNIANEQTHSKYFKHVYLNGHPLNSYIDLGSGCVTIRQDVADELGFTYFEVDVEPLIGYGQGIVQPIGLFSANLTIDDVMARVKIHVVPSKAQVIPLLVGHPFTEQPHVVIISSAEGLKVSHKDDLVQTCSTKTVLRVAEEVVIPSNFLGHITVMSDIKNEELCVEGVMREDGQMIPRCVITTDEEGKSVIPILNVSERPLVINKDATATRGEVCEQEEVEREVNQEEIMTEEVVTDLIGEEKNQLVVLINDYKDLVARNMRQIGCTNKMKMKIELTSNAPIYYRPYRLSHSERNQVKEVVDELMRSDIVEDSSSPFASPVLLVKKKTGDVRLCIDYRAVNKVTVKDHYPIPLIDDQIDRMNDKIYFTSLDLRSGYYQVELDADSRNKTAFITPDGHYQFKRMPFGLCNAPSLFQRLINVVLGNLRYTTAMAYLDDIIIPSQTVDEGLLKLKSVLSALRDAGLTLRLDKCFFCMRRIEYLGFEISNLGIEPGRRKLKSIELFATPVDVKGVRSFMGLASYFRRFIRGFALITKPLTDLLGKNSEFIWEQKQIDAFNEIKLSLQSSPVLSVYNPESFTELHTDACAIGLGAVLLQKQKDGKMHPISYYSRKTTKDEAKYHSYELEALAIVAALERFRVYLLGIEFVIRTDCNSLKMLANKRDLSPRIGRWFVKLSEFNYKIEYHKSSQNMHADSLSRNPVYDSTETELTGLPILGITINTDWIAAMQRDSEEILLIRDKLEAGDRETHEKFSMDRARVYRVTKGRWRLYVPTELRYDLVGEAHRALAHLGIDKTLNKVKETYYFPKMKEFVSKYVNRCINCLYYKCPGGKRPGYLHPLDKGSEPFQCVHIDHLGPFINTKNRNKYVVAVIDGFSKYTILKAVKDVSSRGTIMFLKECISHYGKPLKIVSDRGTAFTAGAFAEFCANYDIQHVKIASGTPRANGQIERCNHVITTCLATTSNREGDDWDEKLFEVQWAINNSVHKVTKRTPFDIIFTYKGGGTVDNPLTLEIKQLNERLGTETEKEPVEELLERNREKLSKQFDSKRKRPNIYEPGDLVLIKSEAVSTGESRKLEPKYRGPYEIVKVLDNDRYLVQDIEGEQQSARIYKGIISVDRLKLVPK
jgi:transposase InsO family protein